MHERDDDLSCCADAKGGDRPFEKTDRAGHANVLGCFVRALPSDGSMASFARFLQSPGLLASFARLFEALNRVRWLRSRAFRTPEASSWLRSRAFHLAMT